MQAGEIACAINPLMWSLYHLPPGLYQAQEVSNRHRQQARREGSRGRRCLTRRIGNKPGIRCNQEREFQATSGSENTLTASKGMGR
jgi:hypothetical protein